MYPATIFCWDDQLDATYDIHSESLSAPILAPRTLHCRALDAPNTLGNALALPCRSLFLTKKTDVLRATTGWAAVQRRFFLMAPPQFGLVVQFLFSGSIFAGRRKHAGARGPDDKLPSAFTRSKYSFFRCSHTKEAGTIEVTPDRW